MSLDLILKDINDVYIRENFLRLSKFINSQIFFEGDFKLYDISINSAKDKFEILHGLNFIPVDVIPLYVEGDFNFYFRYQEFTRTSIFVTTAGPVRLKFLAGRLNEKAGITQSAKIPLSPPNAGTAAKEEVVQQYLNILRINAASTSIMENGRVARIVVDDTDEVTTITGTHRVETTGVTTLGANSVLRIA